MRNTLKRGRASVLLLFTLIIAVVVIVYFVSKNKTTVENTVPIANEEVELCIQITWSEFLPEVTSIINQAMSEIPPHYDIKILETVDLTGDGCTEALVATGRGGAYTGTIAVFTEENDEPVIAQVKHQDASIALALFDEGASVRNRVLFEVLPKENAIYRGFTTFAREDDSLDSCEAEAYIWDSEQGLFDFNASLTGEIETQICS